MAKKVEVPSPDDIRDPRYSYYYSRKDRLSHRAADFDVPHKKQGMERFFGGNKGAFRTFIFFIVFAVFFWFIYFLFENAEEMEAHRTFNFADSRSVQAQFIDNSDKRGIKIMFQNSGDKIWDITGIKIGLGNLVLDTNISLRMVPRDYEIFFIETPAFISNIATLKLEWR